MEIQIPTAELMEYSDEQLKALGLDRRMSATYLPGMSDPDAPYTARLDTAIDPRMVDTGWLGDEDVQMDFLALDLDAFTYDDVDDAPQYWRDLIGRDLTQTEVYWLHDFKLIQEVRQNWNSPGFPEKGQPCI